MFQGIKLLGPVPERCNNPIPGINVPEIRRNNPIPGINVPEIRHIYPWNRVITPFGNPALDCKIYYSFYFSISLFNSISSISHIIMLYISI